MPKSKYFIVTLELGITAEAPREAAQFAYDDIHDKNINPRTFDVVGPDGKKFRINLDDSNDQGVKVIG